MEPEVELAGGCKVAFFEAMLMVIANFAQKLDVLWLCTLRCQSRYTCTSMAVRTSLTLP